MQQIKTEAIILDTIDIFDADRQLILFSRELGKIRARARGVRKPTSRLTGHLLQFLPTQLEIRESEGWFLITQAQLVSQELAAVTYPEAALAFFRSASLVAESVQMLFTGEEAYPGVYDGLEYTFARMRLSVGDNALLTQLIGAEFIWKAMLILGLGLELGQCVVTGEPLQSKTIYWSPRLGGLLNQNGFELSEREGELLNSDRTVVVLRQFSAPDFRAERLQVTNEVAEEVYKLVYDYVEYSIGRAIRSRQCGR